MLMLLVSVEGWAATITSAGNGNWNAAGTWVGGIVPAIGDDVIIASGHTVTLDVNTVNLGTLTVNGTLLLSTFNITVSGATTVNNLGALTDNSSLGGTNTFNGSVTVNAGGTLNSSVPGTTFWNFGGDITNANTFTLGGSANYTFTNNLTITNTNTSIIKSINFGAVNTGTGSISAGKTVTVADNVGYVNFYGGVSFTLGTGASLVNNMVGEYLSVSGITGTGTFINNTNATVWYTRDNMATSTTTFDFTAVGNTVVYSGSPTQNIKAITHHNLSFGNSATTYSLLGNTTVNGNIDVPSNPTLNLSSSTLTLLGNMTINGSLSAGTGTLSLQGATTSLTYTNPLNLYNLTVNKVSNANVVNLSSTQNLTITNTLTLTQGKLQITNNNITLTNATPTNQLLPTLPTNASYIVTNGAGKLFRQNLIVGNSVVYLFPVGDAANLYTVGFELQTPGSGTGTGSVAYVPENPIVTPPLPSGAYDVAPGKWRLQCTWNQTALKFFAPSVSNNMAYVRKDDAGNWTQIPSSFYLSPDYTTGQLNITSETNFTIFATLNSPTAISATNVTKNSFTANWSQVVGCDGYKLDIATDAGFSSIVLNNQDIPNPATLSYNFAASNNLIYYYRVRAYKTTPSFTTGNSNTKMTSTILPAGSGKALRFDGSNHVKSPIPTNYSGGISMEAWIKLDVPTATMQTIIGAGNSSLDGWGVGVVGLVTPGLRIRYNATIFNPNVTIPIGEWIHVALINAVNDQYELYVNGVATTGFTGTVPNPPTSGFWVANDSIANTTNFQGRIDEVRFWDTALSQTNVRDNMCKKLIGNETNLKAYFRFDENVGNITENKAYGVNSDGVLVNAPVWDVSQAALGDISVSRYGYTDGTLGADEFKVTNMTGSPTGFHIYKVNDAPNHTVAPPAYSANGGNILTSRYWGVFVVGGTNPKFDITYSYASNTDVNKPNALRFGRRTNPNGLAWLPYGGVTNGIAKKVARRQAEAGEFILGQRNSIISNALNGGTVVNLDGTANTGIQVSKNVSDDFTIEFWARIEAAGTGAGNWKLGKRLLDASGAGKDFGISYMASSGIAFGVESNTIETTNTVPTSKWFHVAVTRNKTNGEMKIYINGKLEKTGTGSTNAMNATDIYLGRDNTGANTLQMRVDELRIWNTVLSESNIKDYMNLRVNNVRTDFANLTDYYRFDENTGTLSEDLIDGSDATFTTTGATWAASDQALGDGYADRQNATTLGGVTSFGTMVNAETPQIEIEFGDTTVPNGELVATRVSAAPNNYPAASGSEVLNGTTVSYSGVTAFMNAYWVIRNYGTNSTFSKLKRIKFQIPSGNNLGSATANQLYLFKRPTNSTTASDWKLVGRGSSFGSIEFSFAGGPTDIEEFSEFVIGTGSAPLGVSLTNFQGTRLDENTNVLQWITANEQKNKGFEIQRSADGISYQTIGFEDGKGDSQTAKSYQFIDLDAKGAFYYRLFQVDFDGGSAYSPVVYLKGEVGKQEILLYPNPVSQDLKINVAGAVNGVMRVEVYDIQGRLLWAGKGNLKELENSLNLQLNTWKDGTYLFKLYSPEKVLESKFIKRK